MVRFLDAHRRSLPSFLSGMTGVHFTFALLVMTMIALLATWAGARSRPGGFPRVRAVAMQPVLAVNAIQHVATAIWAGGYAPGAATGAFHSHRWVGPTGIDQPTPRSQVDDCEIASPWPYTLLDRPLQLAPVQRLGQGWFVWANPGHQEVLL